MLTLERAGKIVQFKAGELDSGKSILTTNNRGIDDAIRHAMHNKELRIYKLKNGWAKYSFLLVPI